MPDKGIGVPDLPLAERLRRLIAVLDITETDFAQRVGMSPSHVNRLLNGERGKEGASKKLRDASERAFGLRQAYWSEDATRDNPIHPTTFMTATALSAMKAAQKSAVDRAAWAARPPAGFGAQDDPREELRKIAAQRGDHAVGSALTLADAPAEADWPWWVRFYLDELDKARGPR